MFDLKSVFFGYSDAATEAERNPEKFEAAFFDPDNIINELVNGKRYILRGRKGSGKTAYGERIILLEKSSDFYAWKRTLSSFNDQIFAQIKTYDKVGGNPYIQFWMCILLIDFVNMLYKKEPHIQDEDYNNLVYSLNNKGFINGSNDLSVTVQKLVETNSEISINSLFKHNRKHERVEDLRGASQIAEAIRMIIKDLYLTKKFIFILDGIDDVLYNKEFKPDIVTGLIRAIDSINTSFAHSTLKIKILLLVRDDILNICRDPNMNKIKRDSGIRLSWSVPTDSVYDSNLMLLVKRRFELADTENASIETVLNEILPETIGNRNTLDYILDNIIYRPRDILQLFCEIQKEYIVGKRLTVDKIQSALLRFSDEYFVDSMRDELTGFFPDDAVTLLPNILSKMGSRFFYLSDFESECKQYAAFKDVSCQAVLSKLFEDGYIGQHRPRETGDKTVFSYRNPKELFIDEHECIVHRGLTRALTL